jgi:uncharacterized protein
VDKIKLDILGLSNSQSHTGSFALVLGESSGNRRLPIIIGMFEAQAIAIEIEKIVPNRPMTHDLFKSFADSFTFTVDEVVISDLVEGVFFARIRCTNGMQKVEIDARPSDAIAIALRFDAPIFTYETILSEAGIITDDKEEEPEKKAKAEPVSKDMSVAKESKSKPKKGTNMEDFSLEQLQKMLEDALNREDYENAARIRDEMNRRN